MTKKRNRDVALFEVINVFSYNFNGRRYAKFLVRDPVTKTHIYARLNPKSPDNTHKIAIERPTWCAPKYVEVSYVGRSKINNEARYPIVEKLIL